MDVATRDSWKTLPLPDKRLPLQFEASFDPAETSRISQGLVPEEMEDKWFIFCEEGWVYFHHSWTKACIYAVQLERSPDGARVIDSWVNADPDQHAVNDLAYERKFVSYLIDALLLGKPARFPVPSGVPQGRIDLYQHIAVGRVDPDLVASGGGSLWLRLKRWLRGGR